MARALRVRERGRCSHRHGVFDAFLDERGLGRAMQILVGGLRLTGRLLALRHEARLGGAGELLVRRLGGAGILGVGERRRPGDAENKRGERERLGHGIDLPDRAAPAAAIRP